jgi:hypothetical protein
MSTLANKTALVTGASKGIGYMKRARRPLFDLFQFTCTKDLHLSLLDQICNLFLRVKAFSGALNAETT